VKVTLIFIEVRELGQRLLEGASAPGNASIIGFKTNLLEKLLYAAKVSVLEARCGPKSRVRKATASDKGALFSSPT